MKILMVTHWFYPRNIPRAFRATELYKELKNRKYDVDIIIGDTKKIISNEKNFEKILSKVDTYKLTNSNKNLSNNCIIRKLKKYIEYFIGERYLITSGYFIYKNIDISKYDVVISIGLPFYVHLITSIKIKKSKKRIISISDWGDPFFGDKVRSIAPYFNKLQKQVCRTFDYITIPTTNAIEYYKNYKEIEKIRVIPQGFNFDEVKIKEYRKHKVPHFAYAGIFYLDKRNPEELLKYLSELDEKFIFTIYTIKHGEIYEKIIKKYENIMGKKLIVKDLVPRLQCIEELSENDFLINIDNKVSQQVPSKLIDYALTRRPIISFKDDDIPKNQICDFLKGKYENKTIIKLENYDIKNICNQFIKLFEVSED